MLSLWQFATGTRTHVGHTLIESSLGWGNGGHGRRSVPEPNEDFVAIAAGHDHSLGLKSDGTIVAWGNNEYGQLDVPSPNSDFVAIAAGSWYGFSLGLKSDGSVVAWGDNGRWQCRLPEDNSNFVAIAAGTSRSLAIKGHPLAIGDVNCDGDINALDIEAFLVALFEPENYAGRYPDCDINLADINGDGSIDALDIEHFLNLLFP